MLLGLLLDFTIIHYWHYNIHLQLEIIDACVQYIETLQNQLEDHLIQNPHLYVESHNSGRNPSTDLLLHNLMHQKQDTQNTTALETSTYSSDANKSPSSVSPYNSSLTRQKTTQYETNLRRLVNKPNKVDKSGGNYLKCKKFRLRCWAREKMASKTMSLLLLE